MNTVPMSKEQLRMDAGRAPASQATNIEQSRAIAQVQGALIVAQQRPRDELEARDRMEQACQITELAQHAFFRFSRGGSQISGPTIHLATELARCWGNIDYGISELHRDDVKGESEMLAYAWDLETNARNVMTFIVPHLRDKKGGPEPLMEMRDIYENNANQGARRLRECIFRVLPKAYVEAAKAICSETLEKGGGVPLEERRVKLLEAFAALRVSRPMIEKKMGRAADRLTAYDIATLGVVYQSLKRGETTIADEFEMDAGGEIAAQLKPATGKKDAPKNGEPKPEPAKDEAKPATTESTGGSISDEARPTATGSAHADEGPSPSDSPGGTPSVDLPPLADKATLQDTRKWFRDVEKIVGGLGATAAQAVLKHPTVERMQTTAPRTYDEIVAAVNARLDVLAGE